MTDSTSDIQQLKKPTLAFRAYLEEPVSAASLAVFRICFSIAMVALVVEHFRSGWIDVLASKIHFNFVPGVVVLPGLGLYVQLIAVAVFAVMVGLGVYYRIACVLLFISYTWIFLSEKSLYQNHTYLVCLLSLLFSLVGADRIFSIDNLRHKFVPLVPRWNVELFRFQLVVVYFYSGLAKLSSDWLQGYPQTGWLMQRASDPTFGPYLGPLFHQHWFVMLVTYGGIVIDLTIGFLLWWQPTFWLGALIACVFHLLNFTMFNIDIFPFLMIASIGLFAREDWPIKILSNPAFRWCATKNKPVANSNVALESVSVSVNAPVFKTRPALVVFLCAYIAFQLLMPLRRFFYPGDTSWTEQGQRFAWRMMLRDKRSYGFKMIWVHPGNGINGVVFPNLSVTQRQLDDLQVIPDMILQYSHIVADELEKDIGMKPIIRVQALVSLNGRPAQNLVDRKVDLASTPTSIFPAQWIIPLDLNSKPMNLPQVNRPEVNHQQDNSPEGNPP